MHTCTSRKNTTLLLYCVVASGFIVRSNNCELIRVALNVSTLSNISTGSYICFDCSRLSQAGRSM